MKNLKIIYSTVTAMVLISSSSFAQQTQSSSGNCVKKGTIIIDVFYGFPYFNGALLKSAYSSSRSSIVHNYNQFGGKFEYMVSDKIGIGIEGTYALATVNYQANNLQYYTAGISKYRILGKMTYHFATTSSIDPYLTWGAGYKNTNIYSNDPNGTQSVSFNLIPVALRFGVGMRYFFSDVVGINVEAGLGGPLMQAGLSFKF
jgi:hypothetical protein